MSESRSIGSRRPPVHRLAALMLCGCAALGISACGSSGKITGSKSGHTGAAKAPSGTVTVDLPGLGQNLDPTTPGLGDISPVLSENVYQWLTRGSSSGPKPELATAWKYSNGGKTLVLTLRSGVKFDDGSPLTADDVAFTWQRLVANQQAPRFSATLKSVAAQDATHVRLQFAVPDAGFLSAGGFPVISKPYFEKVGASKFASSPDGTGPYEVKNVSLGNSVTLSAFPGYWGPKPTVQHVVYRYVNDDSTRAADLVSGSADVALALAPDQVKRVQQSGTAQVVTEDPGNYTAWLQGQFKSPATPWSKKAVREAMALAINSNAIIKDTLHGQGLNYPGLAPTDLGYRSSLTRYPYDPAQARKLLAQSGYPSGFSTKLYYITGTVGGIQSVINDIVLYLGDVGIKLNPVPLEGPQFIQFVAGASGKPSRDYLGVFAGTLAGALDPTIGLDIHFLDVGPYATYFNPQVSGLIERASATLDRTKRGGMIAQAMQLMHDDYAYVPIFTSVNSYGVNKHWSYAPVHGNYLEFVLANLKPS